MKTLMILLLTISSVRCFAQKPENKDVTEKKRTIKPVRIYDPKLMPVDCTASGVKICSGCSPAFTSQDGVMGCNFLVQGQLVPST